MIEVLKQALEALETTWYHVGTFAPTDDAIELYDQARTSLRQAIAELESQEPVPTIEELEQEIYQNTRNFVSLDVMEWMLKRYYTHLPQRTEQEQPLPLVEIGVDVTADGASVVAFYRRPNAVMEMFYSQFHPAPQRTWVGLTDEEMLHIGVATGLERAAVEMISKKLKEKNYG
jgi:hypothetical protein